MYDFVHAVQRYIKRGVNGTRLRRRGVQGYTQVGVADTRYLSIDLCAEEGKKGPIF